MGSTKIDGGMTMAERQKLLEQENELARERESYQRAQLEEQEKQREAREDAQRKLMQVEERFRTQELAEMEREAAGVAEEGVGEEDVDTTVSDMFAALAYGTEFIGDEEETEEEGEDTPA